MLAVRAMPGTYDAALLIPLLTRLSLCGRAVPAVLFASYNDVTAHESGKL